MTRYPLTLSLTSTIVLVASCSIPVLREGAIETPHVAIAGPGSPTIEQQPRPARQPTSATCPPGGCWTPTPKTLAVDYRPPEGFPEAVQFAVAKLLNEPHTAAALAEPSPAPDTVSEREFSVYFGYADATLSSESRTRLNDAVRDRETLRRIAIRGRTGGLGASPANQRLALARAKAVQQHLLARDATLTTLLEVEARGSCCYVAPNATPRGRALNRRVEITVVRQDPEA